MGRRGQGWADPRGGHAPLGVVVMGKVPGPRLRPLLIPLCACWRVAFTEGLCVPAWGCAGALTPQGEWRPFLRWKIEALRAEGRVPKHGCGT